MKSNWSPYNTSIRRFYQLILSILFTILSLPVISQPANPLNEKLSGTLRELIHRHPAEMIYLQTSKGIYERNEDLWFKATLLTSQRMVPSLLSQTLYLQMTNERTGKVFWQEMYEVSGAFVSGHVYLPDTLPEGDYILSAFSQYSLYGDGSELKSIRKIKIRKNLDNHSKIKFVFSHDYFNEKDSISATVTVLSEQNQPVYVRVVAKLLSGSDTLAKIDCGYIIKGKTPLVFLPQSRIQNLVVEARFIFADYEETHYFKVPRKNNKLIQFDTFPEGGNMVAGIQSTLAFKAVNTEGNPVEVQGTLFEENTPLLEFKSAHAGMGSLGFTPQLGKHYHIRLLKPEVDSSFVLPPVHPEGITLHLEEVNRTSVSFLVSQTPGMKPSTVYLRAQIRGMVYCIASGELSERLKIEIPLEQFPSQGITEFTLFDHNMTPVAERLVYLRPERKLYVEALPDKEKYETRGKVSLKIKVKDENGQPVVSNLCVSVYDKQYHNSIDPENILSNCLLSSQLKGRIYDPTYYFDPKNSDRNQMLDLLLQTQGWRRYMWSESVLNEQGSPTQEIIYNGIKGSIDITSRQKKNNTLPQFLQVFDPEKEKTTRFISLDSTGAFTILPSLLKACQGNYVYLRLPEGQQHINLTDPFKVINQAMQSKTFSYPLPCVEEAMKEQPVQPFFSRPKMINLEEVTIKAKSVKPFRDKYMGHLDSLAKLNLCPDYVCINNYLNCVFHKDDRSRKPVEGKSYNTAKEMDVLTGAVSGVGTIIYHYPIYTEEELMKINHLTRLKAYYNHREFYQTRYDQMTDESSSPDFRNTLLWVPSVITDEKGEASLEFFCSDINTGFVGNIEGVGNEGLLGTQNFEFTVQKMKSLSPLDKTK